MFSDASALDGTEDKLEKLCVLRKYSVGAECWITSLIFAEEAANELLEVEEAAYYLKC